MPKLNLDALSEERLRKSVDPEIYAHGERIFLAGRAQVTELKSDSAHCVVQDKHPYKIEIKVANNFLYLKCNCQYAYRGLICEHEIAACLAIRNIFEKRLPPIWRLQINQVLDLPPETTRKKSISRYWLFFSLQEHYQTTFSFWNIVVYKLPWNSELKLDADTDQQDLVNSIKTNPNYVDNLRSPRNLLNPEGCLNSQRELVTLANLMIERERGLNIPNTHFPLADYLDLFASAQSDIYFGGVNNPLYKKLTLIEAGEIRLSLEQVSDGIHIRPKLFGAVQVFDLQSERQNPISLVSTDPAWILVEDHLIKLANQSQSDLLKAFLETKEIIIPNQDVELFQKKYLQGLAEKHPLEGNLIEWEIVSSLFVKRLYLIEDESGFQVEFRVVYGDVELPFDPDLPPETILQKPSTWILRRVIRQPQEEKKAFEELSSPSYGLKRTPNPPKPNLLTLRARVNPIDFLINIIPRLISNNFEIYGEEKLKTSRVNRNSPTISFHVTSGIDWFDVQAIVNFGEIEVSLKEIHRALRKKEHFIKLSDGTIGAIPDEWMDRYKHLFSLGNETDSGIRLARHHIGLIDQVLTGSPLVETDVSYDHYRQKLLDFSGIHPVDLPNDFQGSLRPYQKAGYDWLHFLHSYRFGGCLADDMGLGKTVQILAFLAGLKEARGSQTEAEAGSTSPKEENNHRKTSLIIVPRSLLVNWQREAARFTPGLRILEYFSQNRQKASQVFDQFDLVITTYGILLRDVNFLRSYPFHYVILDESQTIKNPKSQTARAVRLLQGTHHLVLTGTPIENATEELWSQFSFLNPGLLGTLDYFREEFIAPIEKNGDEKSIQTLRKLVYPFILRRTKDQVAPELPDRTERILYCDMEPAQQKLYQRTRDYYRGVILGMLESEGLSTTRFRILEGLLRLRQISNHPRLVDDKFRGESGKYELLIDTIETLYSEGHKALVFSQFVQMLKLVRNGLDIRKIPYLYLDGHTRDRMELVDQYQNTPDIPFFLISLKAGGQGLNLTAADYVIHIDPWWNPAVEMQASDRTHRIGQTKPVFIFKLITRDSVEEKIIQLQERKKSLVDQLITTETSFFKSLTSEDVRQLFGG